MEADEKEWLTKQQVDWIVNRMNQQAKKKKKKKSRGAQNMASSLNERRSELADRPLGNNTNIEGLKMDQNVSIVLLSTSLWNTRCSRQECVATTKWTNKPKRMALQEWTTWITGVEDYYASAGEKE